MAIYPLLGISKVSAGAVLLKHDELSLNFKLVALIN